MNNALLMLDLDGTLIDTSQLYFQGMPPIVERHLGISISKEDILPMWGQFARNYFDHFAQMGGRQDQRLVDTMYAEFSDFYNRMHNRLSPPYEGVCELLPKLREAAHAVVVVTTRPTSRSAPVLQMSWAGNVDGFIWSDQVERKKPFPDGIECAIRQYAVDGCTCVYLGDNRHDIDAAHAARPKTLGIGALWGAMDRGGLLAAGPDLCFETFKEFSNWVIQGCSTGLST